MRTIVNILSEQTIPNYLFIKEMFQAGDQLMFISSKKMSDRIDWIENALVWKLCDSQHIVLEKDGDEENWSSMSTQIEKYLTKTNDYIVNLTGGTKFMALAVHSIFAKYNSCFYYIPYPKNIILSTDEYAAKPITYRVSVNEYVKLYNQQLNNHHNPCESMEYSDKIFDFFTKDTSYNGFSQDDYDIINNLRAYRNTKIKSVDDFEKKGNPGNYPEIKKPQIKGLGDFLNKIDFKHNGVLTNKQIEFLTGGWFEEYVYYHVKKILKPTDIVLGPKTKSTNNDLDVVFTLGNKLYVIECKTGVVGEKMLKEIVYKASALKENLLGLSAVSYIFSLGKDDKVWEDAAKNMNITYYGRSYFEDEDKFNFILENIRKNSKE